MVTGTFGTVINCMDGRTQLPVNRWLRERFGVDYVDTITEPGPDGILSRPDEALTESIKSRVLISTGKHRSKVVVVVAHDDCAGNPVSRDEHLAMLKRAVDTVAGWNLGVAVVGVWLAAPEWKVEEICRA